MVTLATSKWGQPPSPHRHPCYPSTRHPAGRIQPSMVPWILTFVTYYVTNATKRLMAKGKSEPKGGLPPAPNRLGSLISGLSLRASPLRCFVDLHETNTGGIPYAADLGGVNARLKFHQ